MSAIYGYVRWDGRPVEPETFARMREAMERYPHDGAFYWQEGPCAMGHLLQWDTPESLHETFPLIDTRQDVIFMSVGRIDNRDELFRLLEVPHTERAGMTDGGLMFRACCAWGKDACERMLGNWSFCAWHRREKRLFLGRDHGGIMALYYHKGNGFLAFASSLKGLLCLPEVPRTINELRIAQILTAWPGDGEQTSYQHIYNLKPGHFLEVQEGRMQKTLFWELKEQPDLILPREEDYYERFRELFFEAVRARLRSYKNIGIMLSGGYDSTSIAAVAAIELAKQNRELYAFTSVPCYKDYKVPKGRIGDEGPLAAEMAKKYPNIRHFLVDAAGYDVIGSVEKAVEILDEPMHAAGNQYWIQAILDLAKEKQVGVLLNGQSGNGIISWPTGKARVHAKKGFALAKRRMSFLLQDFHDLIYQPEVLRYPFLRYSDIHPEFARRINLPQKMKEAGHDPRFRKATPFRQAQRLFISRYLYDPYQIKYRKNLWYSISLADPVSDIRLVNFALALPENLYRGNDYRRILVKKGMKGLIPESILLQKTKGIQAADISLRLQHGINDPDHLAIKFSGANGMLWHNKNGSFLKQAHEGKIEHAGVLQKLRSLSVAACCMKMSNPKNKTHYGNTGIKEYCRKERMD